MFLGIDVKNLIFLNLPMSLGNTPAGTILSTQGKWGDSQRPWRVRWIFREAWSPCTPTAFLLCLCHTFGVSLAGSVRPSDTGALQGSLLALCPLSLPPKSSVPPVC